MILFVLLILWEKNTIYHIRLFTVGLVMTESMTVTYEETREERIFNQKRNGLFILINNKEDILEETFNSKPVIDLSKAKKLDLNEVPNMYFIVQAVIKNRIEKYLVKAESAIEALVYSQDELKAPILGVNITEFKGYLETPDNLLEKETGSVLSPDSFT